MVTTGYDHTCAILNTGIVQCWGSNDQGQLGVGTNVGSAVPITVSGLTEAEDIDNGGYPGHSCALGSTGTVYHWGNSYADPNDVNNPKLASPNVVPGLSPFRVTAVSVGAEHECVLLELGLVACWGQDSWGQLGNIATGDSLTPVPILGLNEVVAIAAGGYSTCAITAESRVQCWGKNTDGQLGNSALTAAGAVLSPTVVTVDGITSATSIATGSLHACAVVADGSVRCWGSNTGGELGDGTVTSRGKSTVTVMGLSSATRVAAGLHHTCAIVDNGRVVCWGSNLMGQLGVGNNVDSSIPLTVNGY
jgi:alpha-tubulin suppressor-like RCC1 family protein